MGRGASERQNLFSEALWQPQNANSKIFFYPQGCPQINPQQEAVILRSLAVFSGLWQAARIARGRFQKHRANFAKITDPIGRRADAFASEARGRHVDEALSADRSHVRPAVLVDWP